MKIAVYLSHPAQYLFYRHPFKVWKERGHELRIYIRTKDVLAQLLRDDGAEYENILLHPRKAHYYHIIKALFVRTFKLFFRLRRFHPDILLGTDASMAIIAFLLRKPCFTVVEDDYKVIRNLAWLTYPFTTKIVTPGVCDTGRWSRKQIVYDGYMKLSYLHPNRFRIDDGAANRYNLKKPFCLLRLSKLSAYHDIGIKGMSANIIDTVINLCHKNGKNIYVNAEGTLPQRLQPFQLNIEPRDIHHILANADLLISDSQSMSVEAAMLGVPSVRISDFAGKISVLEELEHTYHLTWGVLPSDTRKLYRLLNHLLADSQLNTCIRQLQQKMIAEKTDVGESIIWLTENYSKTLHAKGRHIITHTPDTGFALNPCKPADADRAAAPDFTFGKYHELLTALCRAGYEFRTFEEYCKGNTEGKFVILRHDVDARATASHRTACMEHALGIRASYYFRITPQSNQPGIIRSVAELGHEIGYHYEEMSTTHGNSEEAIRLFENNLRYFRQFYPVVTVSMHGSPTSAFDNRDLWQKYDYKQWGIIGEPYKDIDFGNVAYLTDTGRCWNGTRYSIRDKTDHEQCTNFKTTGEIIRAAEYGLLPLQIMITTHPQRWTDNRFVWWQEYILQNAKNQIKRLIIRLKKQA
jgi:predicted glycosyltransferase